MYRQNYTDESGKIILPPGYSGTSMQSGFEKNEGGIGFPKPSTELRDGGFIPPRQSAFQERKENEGRHTVIADEKAGGDFLPPANAERTSHSGDILLAGLLMLLISEGKCDEMTLFLLSFLLIC